MPFATKLDLQPNLGNRQNPKSEEGKPYIGGSNLFMLFPVR